MAITYVEQFGFEFLAGGPNAVGTQSARVRLGAVNDPDFANIIAQGTLEADVTLQTGAEGGNTSALRIAAIADDQSRKCFYVLGSALADARIHFVFSISALVDRSSANETHDSLVTIPGFGTNGAQIWVNATGNVELYDGATLLQTGTGFVTATDFHHLEFEIDAAGETLEVRLNGESQFTHTYTGTAPADISTIAFGGHTTNGEYHAFDNLVLYTSDPDEWAGALVVYDMVPDTQASNANFTASGAATIPEALDDIENDGDTTYVSATSVDSNFFVSDADTPTFDGQIESIQMWVDARHTLSSRDFQLQYKVGGSAVDLGGVQSSTGSYATYSARADVAVPVAGANQFQFGLNKDT